MSIYKISGPLLVAMGGLFLSSGGTIFRSFEMADPWAIYFWRSVFFTPAVLLFVYLTNQSQFTQKFKSLGWVGIICAALYATGSGAYMFALKYTTVANVVFIISIQTFFLAVMGYFFLKEKINFSTMIAIILAATGLYVMIGTKISGGSALGNAFAFVIPVAFTLVVITTVANVVFIISIQTFFLAVMGYFFLKEKINFSTMIAIILAATGLYVMIGTKISGGSALGNAFAFVIPVAFTLVVTIIRKFNHIDMVPAVAVSGIFALVVGFIFSGSIAITVHDLILVFFFGALQYAPGFICLTLGSRKTPAAKIGIFTFTEALAGPIWAWMFINEIPPLGVFIGGGIIFLAILLKTFKA